MIQIFITTHNRAKYLEQAIQSILNQTLNIDRIIVLDNDSKDNTKQIVSKFDKCEYIRTEGFLGNYKKSKELITKPYCMLFHDDDLLNPEYLEFATKLINKHEPSIITTRYTRFINNDLPDIKKINKKYYLFNNQVEFARYMVGVEGVSYAPAVYKSEYFLREDLEYNKYGKFNDWILMTKISNYGNSIITRDEEMMYCRIHDTQDTRNQCTCVTGEQIVNWDKFFYDILKDTDLDLTAKSYKFLYSKYEQFTSDAFKKKISFDEIHSIFLKKCPNVPLMVNDMLLQKKKEELQRKCLMKL